jgi:hypothetical protein
MAGSGSKVDGRGLGAGAEGRDETQGEGLGGGCSLNKGKVET